MVLLGSLTSFLASCGNGLIHAGPNGDQRVAHELNQVTTILLECVRYDLEELARLGDKILVERLLFTIF